MPDASVCHDSGYDRLLSQSGRVRGKFGRFQYSRQVPPVKASVSGNKVLVATGTVPVATGTVPVAIGTVPVAIGTKCLFDS